MCLFDNYLISGEDKLYFYNIYKDHDLDSNLDTESRFFDIKCFGREKIYLLKD